MSLFGQGTLVVGQLKLIQRRALLALELLLLLCLGRGSILKPCSLLNIVLILSDQGTCLFNSPMYSGTLKESTAHGFACLQSKTGDLTWRGNSVHTLAWFRFSNNELYRCWVPSCSSTRAGKLIYSFIYSTQSQPVNKPDQRIQTTVQPIL